MSGSGKLVGSVNASFYGIVAANNRFFVFDFVKGTFNYSVVCALRIINDAV